MHKQTNTLHFYIKQAFELIIRKNEKTNEYNNQDFSMPLQENIRITTADFFMTN